MPFSFLMSAASRSPLARGRLHHLEALLRRQAERLGVGARLLAQLREALGERRALRLVLAAAAREQRDAGQHDHDPRLDPVRDPVHGRGAYRRSQARPAARTVSSCRGDELHVPDGEPGPADQVDPAQERRQRQPHLVLVGVLGGQLDADARAHVEIDVGLVRAPGRAAPRRRSPRPSGSTSSAGLELRPDHRAVLVGARGERVAMALDGLVEEQRPHVAARGGHLGLDDARAEPLEIGHPGVGRVARLGLPPVADLGRPPQKPDRQPVEPGLRHGEARKHRPEQRARPRRCGPSARPCRASGRAGRRRRAAGGPSAASGPPSRRRPTAAGSSSRCRCRARGRRARRRAPRRSRPTSRRWSSRDGAGCARRRTTG